MLSEDELNMLVRLFIKKMSTQIPELFESIQKKDYKKISLIAHSIKGSSGNFRMQELQKITSEVENKAKNKDINYDYASMFEKIQDILNSIEIS